MILITEYFKSDLEERDNEIINEIRLGHRFFTPISYLEKAMTTRTSYKDEEEKYSKKN